MGLLRWIVASGFRVALAIALLVGGYHLVSELSALAGRPLSFLQRLELTALDVKFSFRSDRPPDRWQVAIAAVDERAIRRFGPLPWTRGVHAQVVDRLTELGAKAVAFDMTFEQPAASAAKDSADALELSQNGALEKTQKTLDRSAADIDQVAIRLRRMRRPRALKRFAKGLSGVAQTIRQQASDIGTFRVGFVRPEAREDPDVLFARAISRSGRVVLGVVGLSEREVRNLGVTPSEQGAAFALVATSTISEISAPGSPGMMQVMNGSEAFENGLFHRFFGLSPPAIELAVATRHFALINAVPDQDGVNRRMTLVSGFKGRGVLLPTLALKAVAVALDEPMIEVVQSPDAPAPDGIRIADRYLETELRVTTTLDWYGAFDTSSMPIFSIADLIEGTVSPTSVDGRAVFVAATAIGTHDQRVTPLERAVPGVYIHATLAQNLFDQRNLVRPLYVVFVELGVILLIGVLSGLLMSRASLAGQLAVALALAVGWILADQYVFFARGWVVYTVLPVVQVFLTLLAATMWKFLGEQRERRRTRAAFGQYLSPRVLEHVLSEPEKYLKLGGQRYEATVLFSDIRGFTTFSEQLSPEELGALLNQYMTPMTDIVFRFQGTLDKYIGDAVMAFWGAPIRQADHALLACRASLSMLAEVEALNLRLDAEGLPRIAIGIGLSSGPMTIGNMGSNDHFAYTALGDRVNLGARLEGQTKDYGVDILIAEATWEAVQEDMLCRELGLLRVKGKNEPVRIFELIGPRGGSANRTQFVRTFHDALTSFRGRNWEIAGELFQRARALAGPEGDRACDLYIQWSEEYRVAPPPPDWDGVRTATTK